MEIRHFHYIRTIYETGSISRAAEKLYISQPSLSQLLKSVEKKVGAPLFDRGSQPLRPTTIGQKYLETAQRIMELDTEFHRYVEDELGCAQGNLVVGSSPFRSTYFLASFLPEFQEKYPGIRLQLAEHTSKRLEEAVLSGDADLIIATQPVDANAFSFAELYSEEMVLVLPAGHELSKQYHLPQDCRGTLPLLPIGLLKDTPFIQMHSEQKLHQQLLSLCEEAGFTPKIYLQTRSMETALTLAAAGLGATLLPMTLLRAFQPKTRPCYAALPTRPRRHALVAWRKKSYLSHAARAFIDSLVNYCRDKGDDI
ncbi:LysR family transcriptional regulator [Mitsuokella multacida]|uniref:LysR substrate binding domain protein n=1 Tax=Mitsuokella multacida DSM 20544 TaxID=500635 RepID=C9KMN5_9FIRM|nr:LysR family transcriptional regulator [Mitsuokella multacida]EEX68942.1 LysR substrate binding domain protein [Mitsuokella multacida DSM 20544]